MCLDFYLAFMSSMNRIAFLSYNLSLLMTKSCALKLNLMYSVMCQNFHNSTNSLD